MSIAYSELELALGINGEADERETEIREIFTASGLPSMKAGYFVADYAAVMTPAAHKAAVVLLAWGVENGVLAIDGTQYVLQPAKPTSVPDDVRRERIFSAINTLVESEKAYKPKPRASDAANGKRHRTSKADLDALCDSVRNGMLANGVGSIWTRADVQERWAQTEGSVWFAVIKRLVADKVVEKIGEKATAAYKVLPH